eukprot:285794-Pelagomonas_calceolata.AAC.6
MDITMQDSPGLIHSGVPPSGEKERKGTGNSYVAVLATAATKACKNQPIRPAQVCNRPQKLARTSQSDQHKCRLIHDMETHCANACSGLAGLKFYAVLPLCVHIQVEIMHGSKLLDKTS